MKRFAAYLSIVVLFASCKKDETNTPEGFSLYLVFQFDSTQARLNNIGQPSVIPTGNAALSPVFNSMSSHYVELAGSAFDSLGKGVILYKAPETNIGGANAIDFDKSNNVGNGEIFLRTKLKDIPPGNYEWLRVSLAYQNYNVKYHIDTTISTPAGPLTINQMNPGTVASFIGFNTYISDLLINSQTLSVNGNRKQGFWAFETALNVAGTSYQLKDSGQAPPGATTVVNPIFATSPIPQGSCVVTAAFKPGKLTITGNETKDIIVYVSLSTNKSFEWKDVVPNNVWDPLKGEKIVDMGIRGMIPTIQ